MNTPHMIDSFEQCNIVIPIKLVNPSKIGLKADQEAKIYITSIAAVINILKIISGIFIVLY